jgi:uncharacterized repeat protein (TIGR01451 family)
MNNVRTWISRVTAVALVATSVTVSAGVLAPDFLVHKANVNLRTSSQSTDGIDTNRIRTKQVINYLMGRYADLDGKNEKDENLGLITGCSAVGVDFEAVALAVYDRKARIIKPLSDILVFDIADVKAERRNGNLRNADVFGFLEGIIERGIGDIGDLDPDVNFMSLTSRIKYGKIGNRVVKTQPIGNTWSKDTICAQNFKTKSITGFGDEFGLDLLFLDSIVMSGKITAQRPVFGFNDPDLIDDASVFIEKSNGIDDNILLGPDTIEYVITVSNTGTEILTGVVIEDDYLGPNSLLVCGDDIGGGIGDFDGILAPLEDVICTGDRIITDADYIERCDLGNDVIRNIATVSTDQTDTLGVVNDTFLDCQTASVFINKSNGIGDNILRAPGDIEYSIRVENTGGVTLTDVVVNDPFFVDGVNPLLCGDLGGFDGILLPGADVVCVGDRIVDAEEFTALCLIDPIGDGFIRNIATVRTAQTDPLATSNVTFLDCDWLIPPLAPLSIVKGADVAEIGLDGLITYAVVVTNVSATPVLNVVVVDTFEGVVGNACATGSLAVGEELLCAFTLDVDQGIWDEVCGFNDGIIRNVAVVSSTGNADFATDYVVEIDDCVSINP